MLSNDDAGDVLYELDAHGDLRRGHAYEAYGKRTSHMVGAGDPPSSDPLDLNVNPYGFHGMYHDVEDGDIYDGVRTLGPDGVFTSQGDSRAMNRYVFADDDVPNEASPDEEPSSRSAEEEPAPDEADGFSALDLHHDGGDNLSVERANDSMVGASSALVSRPWRDWLMWAGAVSGGVANNVLKWFIVTENVRDCFMCWWILGSFITSAVLFGLSDPVREESDEALFRAAWFSVNFIPGLGGLGFAISYAIAAGYSDDVEVPEAIGVGLTIVAIQLAGAFGDKIVGLGKEMVNKLFRPRSPQRTRLLSDTPSISASGSLSSNGGNRKNKVAEMQRTKQADKSLTPEAQDPVSYMRRQNEKSYGTLDSGTLEKFNAVETNKKLTLKERMKRFHDSGQEL